MQRSGYPLPYIINQSNFLNSNEPAPHAKEEGKIYEVNGDFSFGYQPSKQDEYHRPLQPSREPLNRFIELLRVRLLPQH
jgi:hypothetical protein